MSHIVSCIGLSLVLICQGLSFGQEKTGVEHLEKDQEAKGASFLRAMALNAANVQTVDVLIREEHTHDIAANRAEHIRLLTRLIIDFSNQRFLIVQFGESSRIADEAESKQSLRFSTRYDGAELFESQFKRVGGTKMSFKEAVYRLPAIVDFRYVGFRQFPAHFCKDLEFDTLLAATEKLDSMCVQQKVGPTTIQASMQGGILNSEDTTLQSWIFDQERLIALSYSHSISRKENGVPTVYPRTRETIEWQDQSGTYVPKKVKAVRLGQTQLEDSGKVLSYEIDIDAAFHWFSVNQPLGDDKFSADYLSDASKAFTLVDPKLSGAKSLQE